MLQSHCEDNILTSRPAHFVQHAHRDNDSGGIDNLLTVQNSCASLSPAAISTLLSSWTTQSGGTTCFSSACLIRVPESPILGLVSCRALGGLAQCFF